MANMRVTFDFGEFSTRGAPNLRTTEVASEFSTRGRPNARITEVLAEFVTRGRPNARITEVILEQFIPVPPEPFMSTEKFPGFGNSASNPAIPQGADPFNSALPGLTFSVHKKPGFNTRVSEATSGFEVRNALMEFPRWDFELSYEFLEDRTGAESSLKTILGFFLARQGSFDSWLFKDPDDYLCVGSTCGYPDGVTTVFYFCREMTGGFLERVGQVDEDNTINLYLAVAADSTVPASPGPYTRTFSTVLPIVDAGVVREGVTMTKVAGAPASINQYQVNEATGVYTFHSSAADDAIVVSYSYTIPPADYTITMPNRITFDVAPPEGVLTGDFQFFFVCRFLEDQMDFEKFADQLWNLQQCDFRSLIQ